ncbi:MAG: hypothetical protein CVV25_04315 [Ignavibacteriae bacterium HGW-Ignavibacteriae-4]|jgi:hypothetical protein|nr:MAG: hypothetical protein CVV25_04315 [Ignavibacteriae bacterium HGW-Ignavibacteriae-4]
MNKFITKQGSRLAALAAGIVLFSFTATAQDLINSKKVNNAGGTIKFKSNAGTFQNSAAIGMITNTGVIEMLGTDNTFTGTNTLSSSVALRVPGQVSYASPAAAQNVFPGYYTDLDMKDAGVKNFNAANVFIGQNYTTAGGNRNYGTSLITYDGAVAQSIAAENTGNGTGYNNLDFTNAGLKTLSSGAALVTGTTGIDVSATGGVSIIGATAALTSTGIFTQDPLAGDFSLSTGGTATLLADGNLIQATTQVNNGTLHLGDGTNPTNTTITNGGSLNLADDANALLDVTGSTNLNVDGGFTNLFQARSNMNFDNTSLVDYQDGATSIVTTIPGSPYGKFEISKSNGPINATNNGGAVNDLEINTSFAMSGGSGNNLDMLNSTGGKVNLTSGTAGNVTYAGNEEVVGEFRRTHAAVAGVDYVFNNAATVVNFTTAPAAGNYFAVIANPNGTTASYDPTRDVERDINIEYDYTAWVADVTAGYQASDIPATWTAGFTEAQLRFREGDAIPADEKVSTGNTYTRVASGAGSLGSVKLPGITPTAAAVDGLADGSFLSGNDLILRAGPAIWYSVNPGRWSNPATWDEGTEPPTDAEVVIRHNVHAGFIRADGYPVDEATPGAMATKITIQTPTGPDFLTPTLMIGSSDIVGTFATSTVPVAGITNPGRIIVENVVTEVPVPGGYAAEDTGALTNFVAGLVVFGGAEITASESLINDGCLNIGGTLGIGQ